LVEEIRSVEKSPVVTNFEMIDVAWDELMKWDDPTKWDVPIDLK
jgi:hypothetical protein